LPASGHADRIALDGATGDALEHAAARHENHRRMNDEALDFSGLNNSRELRPLQCHGSDAISDAAAQCLRKNRLERKPTKEIFSQFDLA